ncbi:hypothetical protein TNCV_769101 [Trichonephila clavipes]|nr:hypothetical protein TNCV_769101 [Trichonephila clavipes]
MRENDGSIWGGPEPFDSWTDTGLRTGGCGSLLYTASFSGIRVITQRPRVWDHNHYATVASGVATKGLGGAMHRSIETQRGPQTSTTKQAKLATISPKFKI